MKRTVTAAAAAAAIAVTGAACGGSSGVSSSGGDSGGSDGGGSSGSAALTWACDIIYGQSGGQPDVAAMQATNPSSTPQQVTSVTITYSTDSGMLTDTVRANLTVPANGTKSADINPAPDAATGCQITRYNQQPQGTPGASAPPSENNQSPGAPGTSSPSSPPSTPSSPSGMLGSTLTVTGDGYEYKVTASNLQDPVTLPPNMAYQAPYEGGEHQVAVTFTVEGVSGTLDDAIGDANVIDNTGQATGAYAGAYRNEQAYVTAGTQQTFTNYFNVADGATVRSVIWAPQSDAVTWTVASGS